MAIEYIYDCIKATADEDMTVTAFITDEQGLPVTEGCKMRVLDIEDDVLVESIGTYDEESMMWSFFIAKEDVEGAKGKFWYSMIDENGTLHFQQPFYLI